MLWDVRVDANVPHEADADVFHKKVKAHPAVREVRAPAPGYPPPSAAFLVEASTAAQARELAEAIGEEAFEALLQAFPAQGDGLGSLVGPGVEVYPHRSGRRVTGPGVAF